MDTRGTLFFEVERILKEKKPFGFVLENVEGLVNHDKENSDDQMGRTLTTILQHLKALGYKVSWKVLNAKEFGVPQDRKRIYIVGTKKSAPDLNNFKKKESKLEDVLENGLETVKTPFVELLLKNYSLEELPGKAIKDKRGGDSNIHSWDIELKGSVTEKQKALEELDKIIDANNREDYADVETNITRKVYKISIDEESKIGKLVRETMMKLSESGFVFREDLFCECLTKKWSKDNLGLYYPLFKIVNEDQPIENQTKDYLGNNRYYSTVYSFGDKRVLITSEWYKENKIKYIHWFNELIENF